MTIQAYPGDPDWPTEWQGSRFTGKFVSFLGEPMVGTITFTPSTTAVISATSKVIVAGGAIAITLDATGAFDVILPATDDPDTNPTGWTYAVTESWPAGRKYNVAAPMNQTQDLTAVVPVPSANGTAIVRGMSAYEVAVANGFVGTESAWLASLVGPQGPQGPTGPAGTMTDATTTAKGAVQLAGDLAGTAASPSVAKVKGVAVSGTPTAGQVLTASSGTAAAWATPSGATPDATTTSKGVVQLAGDLGGTAAAPTVPGLAAKATDTAVVHLAGAETVTGAKIFTGGLTVSTANLTITDKDVVLSATTGTKFGTSATQKLAFFNAAPVAQQGATIDLGVLLSNLGLRAAGTAFPLSTTGACSLGATTLSSSLTKATVSQTTATLALGNHHNVFCSTAANSVTVTLPTAVGVAGLEYYVKKTTSDANTVTIATTSAQTINGAANLVLTRQYEGVKVVSDGANWLVLNASRVHSHDGAHITSGTVAPARLGTGTADGTTYLRGDGAWAVPAASGTNIFPKRSQGWIGQHSITTYATGSNGALPSGRLQCELLILTEPTTLDQVGINVTTAGAAGSVVRMGIYSITSSGDAGTLKLDAGTTLVDGTGDKTLTVNVTLQPGAYWMCMVSNDASGTLRLRATTGSQSTLNHLLSPFGAAGPTTANFHGTAVYYTGYTATSALPATATVVGKTIQCIAENAFPELPMMWVRKA